mgnify:CR=1 FL=1
MTAVKWLEVHIDTNHTGLEPVETMLSALGIDGVVIDDETEFEDFLENNRQYWDYVDEDLRQEMQGRSRITFYLEAGDEGFAKLGEVRIALEELKKAHPDTDYYFIMGADSLFQIETWHEPPVIMADCVILAAMRNHTPDDVFKKQMDYLEAKYHADIRFLNIPDLALSSSEIRHRVREHQSIRFMVPEGVREYIEEHQLYCR